jgi:hypothetical protein
MSPAAEKLRELRKIELAIRRTAQTHAFSMKIIKSKDGLLGFFPPGVSDFTGMAVTYSRD